jgi:hypothetical protein
MGRNRRRIYALVSVIAVIGASLAVAPALGDHQGGSVTQVEFRAFGGGPRIVAAGHADQPLVTKNNACDLADDGSLLKFDGDNRGPGIANLGIGVKSAGSNSNGTPCSQVDSNEKLSISPGSSLSGRAFSGVELDLEMAGNAIVKMTFSPASGAPVTYELHTGTSFNALCATTQDGGALWPGCNGSAGSPTVVTSVAGVLKAGCNAPQNSGPNSGANDNCIWIVHPGVDATRIDLTTSVGTVSLEGGSDTNRPSIFYLADNTPRAVDDTVFIPQGASSILIDVLANDSPPAPVSTIASVGTAAKGTATVQNGKILYTPTAAFDGFDTFSYTMSTSAGTDSADVFVYELFGCDGPPLEVEKGGVTAEYERIPSEECPDKSYEIDVITTIGDDAQELPTLLFKPRLGDNPDCSLVPRPEGCSELFKATLTFAPRLADNPVNSGQLQYDPADDGVEDFRPVQWCKVNPFAGYDPDAENPYPNLPADPDDVLPAGESWCIAHETTVPAGSGFTQTTWALYGIGDPLKRVS